MGDRIFEDLGRDGWFDVSDCERTEAQTTVADLIPVVRILVPSARLCIHVKARLQTHFYDRSDECPSLIVAQDRVEPVIGHANRICHFGGIQEVCGVPVREGARRHRLGDRTIRVRPVAVDVVNKPEQADSLLHPSAYAEKPASIRYLVVRRRGIEQLVRIRP